MVWVDSVEGVTARAMGSVISRCGDREIGDPAVVRVTDVSGIASGSSGASSGPLVVRRGRAARLDGFRLWCDDAIWREVLHYAHFID